MDDLNKDRTFPVRFTERQLERIRKAAAIESQRRSERVMPTTLIRETAMARVEEILASAEPPESANAAVG